MATYIYKPANHNSFGSRVEELRDKINEHYDAKLVVATGNDKMNLFKNIEITIPDEDYKNTSLMISLGGLLAVIEFSIQ